MDDAEIRKVMNKFIFLTKDLFLRQIAAVSAVLKRNGVYENTQDIARECVEAIHLDASNKPELMC